MQDIEFETDQKYTPGTEQRGSSGEPTMVRWLMKLGVSDASSANYILLGIAGLFLGITIFLYADLLIEPKVDQEAEARDALLMQQGNL